MQSIRPILALVVLSFAAHAAAAPLVLPWINGDFTAGQSQWNVASTNGVADHDGDGDQELALVGCGDGTLQASRGISKGVAPGTADVAFTVETGRIDFWDVRMILADAHDPEPFLNNHFFYDATGTLQPDWLDDQVLAWYSWSSPLEGDVVLDPVDAVGYNIPGWGAMDAAAREAYLGTTVHAVFVVYGCTTHGATVDDFAFVL